MQVWAGFRIPRASLRLAALVLVLLLPAVSCGGKKRPPPLPPSGKSGQPAGKRGIPSRSRPVPAGSEAPRVRLLLKENFQTVTVRGSRLARLVVASATAKRITIRAGNDEKAKVLGTGTGFRMEPVEEPLLLDGVPYRGVIELFINPLSVPVVVNEVDLEDYLRGAVPNELHPSRFPEIEALKAQAVAARTFALYHLGTFVRRGFDLYSDERSQVYSGIKAEHPVSDEAIAETRGIIATYDGRPILSVYSSTCGGKTESYAAVFQRELPYLKGGATCSDEISPFYAWETSCSIPRLEANLNRRVAFGHLRELQTVKRGVSGRAIEMRALGSTGALTLRGNEIRSALGLRSTLITDMREKRDDDDNITELVVKGKGWGHGVGLCQFGAVALARRHSSYEKILKHYYNDIELKRNH